MSQEELVQHWRRGAHDALRIAHLCLQEGVLDMTLFHCHLAVEKALKARYIQEKGEEHPKTHRLLELAHYLDISWTSEEMRALAELTDFAIEARYAEPERIHDIATEENCRHWLQETQMILSKLLP